MKSKGRYRKEKTEEFWVKTKTGKQMRLEEEVCPMAQVVKDDEEKKFANLMKNKISGNITLEETWICFAALS
jgi:hypothetical protein